MSMDLKQLSTFVQVAELGSLSKAAGKLRIAQPALSRQIRMLEQDLKVRLFNRHGRGMSLTETGQLLLIRAQSILRQIDATRADLIDQDQAVRGQVRLGVPPTVGDVLAARLLEKFHARYPGVMVRVVPAFSGYLMDFLHRGEVDLAIMYGIERGLDVGLLPLIEENLYLVGSGRAGLSRDVPVTLDWVAKQILALPGPRHGLRVLIEKEARRKNLSLTVPIEADALQTLKDLVSRGLGFTVLPLASVHKEILARELSAAPIHGPKLVRKLILVQPLGQPVSNAVKFFAEMLKSEIAEMVAANIIDGRLLTRSSDGPPFPL